MIRFLSHISVVPFHTKRSTRLPSSGTSASSVESAPRDGLVGANRGRWQNGVEPPRPRTSSTDTHPDCPGSPDAARCPSSPRSDAEFTARSSTVPLHRPIGDALHLSRGLLDHQEVVGPEECHADRCVQTRNTVETVRLLSITLGSRRWRLRAQHRTREYRKDDSDSHAPVLRGSPDTSVKRRFTTCSVNISPNLWRPGVSI